MELYDSIKGFETSNPYKQFNKNPRYLGDIDGDGKSDIIYFNKKSHVVSFSKSDKDNWDKDSNSDFEPAITLSSPLQTLEISNNYNFPRLVYDMNKDGKSDIVAFEADGVYICYSKGRNVMDDYVKVSEKLTGDYWISDRQFPRFLGDVDGDGFGDLIGFGKQGVEVYYYVSQNNYEGGVRLPELFPLLTEKEIHINRPRAVGDIDGDGKDDIVVFQNDGVYVAYSNGRQNFSPLEKIIDCTFSKKCNWSLLDYHPRFVRDYNGDGKADIIGFSESQVVIMISKGRQQFYTEQIKLQNVLVPKSQYFSTNYTPQDVGDINGDGILDLVGFGRSSVQIVLSKVKCTHVSRLQENSCECKNDQIDGGSKQPCNPCNTDSTRFIDPNGYCSHCQFPCLKCNKTAQNCTQCVIELNRDTNPPCKCRPGYYDNKGICSKCEPPCQTCENTADYCTSCLQQNQREDASKKCACKKEFYEEGNSCRPCQKNCLNCSSAVKCEQCKGENRNLEQNCECKEGYKEDKELLCKIKTQCKEGYVFDQKQQQCQRITSSVISKENCNINDNRVYINGKCICDAMFGEDGENNSGKCKKTENLFIDGQEMQITQSALLKSLYALQVLALICNNGKNQIIRELPPIYSLMSNKQPIINTQIFNGQQL